MANARTEGHKMTIFSLSNLTALGCNSARELCFPNEAILRILGRR